MPKRQTYSELLSHPLWQRKRLEVLGRAQFECESCGGTETTLHVHHLYYLKGAKPWEDPDEALQALCAPCHEEETEFTARLTRLILGAPRSDREVLVGFALVLRAEEPTDKLGIESYEQMCGAVACVGGDGRLLPKRMLREGVDTAGELRAFACGEMK